MRAIRGIGIKFRILFSAIADLFRPLRKGTISFDGHSFGVEVADSYARIRRGLSGRTSLEGGMLFIFKDERRYNFWMKGMRFPIDIVWIDSSWKVVEVTGSIPPMAENKALFYSPKSPCRYVLEIGSGKAASLGIGVGTAIKFDGN